MIKVLLSATAIFAARLLLRAYSPTKVNSLGLAHNFEIDSFATSREEIGNPPHYGTVNKLREEHIPLVPHHAKQIHGRITSAPTTSSAWIPRISAI